MYYSPAYILYSGQLQLSITELCATFLLLLQEIVTVFITTEISYVSFKLLNYFVFNETNLDRLCYYIALWPYFTLKLDQINTSIFPSRLQHSILGCSMKSPCLDKSGLDIIYLVKRIGGLLNKSAQITSERTEIVWRKCSLKLD